MGLSGAAEFEIVRGIARVQTDIPIVRPHSPLFAELRKGPACGLVGIKDLIIGVAQRMPAPLPLPLFHGKRTGILPRNDATIRQPERIEVHAVPALQREKFLADLLGHGLANDDHLAEAFEQSEESHVGDQLRTNHDHRPAAPPSEVSHPEQNVEHAEMADLGRPFLRDQPQLIKRDLQFVEQALELSGERRRNVPSQLRLGLQGALEQPDADIAATDMRHALAGEVVQIMSFSGCPAKYVEIVRHIVRGRPRGEI